MSAKQLSQSGSFQSAVSVTSRDLKLELSAEAVSVHRNGIEFRSPQPFTEWSEMTLALLARDGRRVSCQGVIVACSGNKHTGYHVSMVFTGLNSETERQLGTLARSEFGAG